MSFHLCQFPVSRIERYVMAWTVPQYKRGQIDAAGCAYLSSPAFSREKEVALDIISNWRSSHSYPLHALNITLRTRAKTIDKYSIVAQRLKRLSSISSKLVRNENMKLSQMQDIGGCRAVLKLVGNVQDLVLLYEVSAAKNPKDRQELVKKYDYIASPKPDGYRSIHLVYKYRSRSPTHSVYNGHRIEIQLRSQLQHAWATAVETVSTFTGQALKSNIGTASWKRFFLLMGSAIALRESCPLVEGAPAETIHLFKEIRDLSNELKIETVLSGWSAAVDNLLPKGTASDLYLLVLDSNARAMTVTGFTKWEITKASAEYLRVETENANKPEMQAVLVSVESIDDLRSAYPNYYLDTAAFLAAVRTATKTVI